MTSVRNGLMPPSFLSNLQDVLKNKKAGEGETAQRAEEEEEEEARGRTTEMDPLASSRAAEEEDCRPVVLLTSEEGIEAPGLRCLLDALLADQRFNINVCAPESNKSGSGHSVTLSQAVCATSVDMLGVTAYQVSGTPVDCVSLGLSGALFSWKKPTLVISGINKGSNCGYRMLYSGTVAGAREALMMNVPSIAISLNWKDTESSDDDLKEAAKICLPLIHASVQDIQKGLFPKGCALIVDVPTHPSDYKGIKVTRQSTLHWHPKWKPVNSPKQYMSKQHGVGIQLAQLGLAASAMGAARRVKSQRKVVEVESVGESGKPGTQSGVVKKFLCAEICKHQQEDTDNDIDTKALEEGFVTVTPVGLGSNVQLETHASVATWIDTAVN
eukprot:TRINITY_DN1897_c0_g2_i1.p1 TRINITY_DN1897_c0_g2~~TRINITY_DN1897_c0_g2_i1.p1  ORF type:complete len:385 (+),score=85.11 TRINITY_DN1897_c0_g2_i1:392-1546(+)